MKFIIAMCLFTVSIANAELIVHGVELRIGKGYRYDNRIHPLGLNHAMLDAVLPDGVNSLDSITRLNSDGSYTVFFSTLEQLLLGASQISKNEKKRISLLTVEGHGMPGQMLYPRDEKELYSSDCDGYRDDFFSDDKSYYKDGYSLPTKEEIIALRDFDSHYKHSKCSADLSVFQEMIGRIPDIKASLAEGAEVRLLSCLTGLGRTGEVFNEGLATLLFDGKSGQITTPTNYVLGDWTTDKGLLFWDYISDKQLAHDTKVFLQDNRSTDIMQDGTLLVTSVKNGVVGSRLAHAQSFLPTKQ